MKSVFLAVVGAWLVVACDELVAVRVGEPLVQRWLRACAAHPVRLGLALLLGRVALLGIRPSLGNAATGVYDAGSPLGDDPDADRPGSCGPQGSTGGRTSPAARAP